MKTEQTGTPYTVDQMIEAIQLVMTERDRLKAANAEMLEALRRAIAFCEDITQHRPTVNPMASIRAAIAKAEGL